MPHALPTGWPNRPPQPTRHPPQRLARPAVLHVDALRAEQAHPWSATTGGSPQRRQGCHGQPCERARQLAKGVAAAAGAREGGAAGEAQGAARGGGGAAGCVWHSGGAPHGGRRQPLLRRLLQRVCGGAGQRGEQATTCSEHRLSSLAPLHAALDAPRSTALPQLQLPFTLPPPRRPAPSVRSMSPRAEREATVNVSKASSRSIRRSASNTVSRPYT